MKLSTRFRRAVVELDHQDDHAQDLEGLVASAVIEIDVAPTVALGKHIGTVNASAEGGQTTLTFTITVVAAALR